MRAHTGCVCSHKCLSGWEADGTTTRNISHGHRLRSRMWHSEYKSRSRSILTPPCDSRQDKPFLRRAEIALTTWSIKTFSRSRPFLSPSVNAPGSSLLAPVLASKCKSIAEANGELVRAAARFEHESAVAAVQRVLFLPRRVV